MNALDKIFKEAEDEVDKLTVQGVEFKKEIEYDLEKLDSEMNEPWYKKIIKIL